MTFQADITTIYKSTGKTPEDFRRLAEEKGLLEPGVKATWIYDWLKAEYGLGLGHARAIHLTLTPHIKKDTKKVS